MAESEKPGTPGNPVKPEALLKPAPELETKEVVICHQLCYTLIIE